MITLRDRRESSRQTFPMGKSIEKPREPQELNGTRQKIRHPPGQGVPVDFQA